MEKILFPDETIIVTKHFDVHQDWETPIPGFFIIAAKRKTTSIADFTETEQQEFFRLLTTIRKAMREVLGIEYVVLYQNEATEWNDFHIWLFPRYGWMKKFSEKMESIKPIIHYAKENMADEATIQEVRYAVTRMKEYISKVW